jgi:hypothetical protein
MRIEKIGTLFAKAFSIVQRLRQILQHSIRCKACFLSV